MEMTDGPAAVERRPPITRRILVAVPYLYDTVPGQRFRIEQWARLFEKEGIAFHFIPFESEELRRVLHTRGHYVRKISELTRCMIRRFRWVWTLDDGWDAVVVYRELLPLGPPILERWLARKGIPIVFDFDDSIFLPDVSDANRRFGWLKYPGKTAEMCRLSAHVTVGNQYLLEYARRYTERVSVIPTTIDIDAYTMKADNVIRGQPVIGWSGSLTTFKHLKILEPTLRALRQAVEFKLKVVGVEAVEFDGLDVESQPWTAEGELEALQSFDVGIMPLPDDAWARGKCGLKALQYMAVGVPTVASPVGVNTEIVIDGQNGFLASTEGEWIDKLSRLLGDQALREQLAREGRRTVEERYPGHVHGRRLLEVLQRVHDASRAGHTPEPVVVALADASVSGQLKK